MSRSTLSTLFCLLVYLTTNSLGARAYCDQDQDEQIDACKYLTPNCLEYEYVPDNQNPGRYIFRCLSCIEGMVPYWTFNNVTLSNYRGEEHLPQNAVSMCAPNSEGKPVKCSSTNCFKKLFIFCSKFVVINPEHAGTSFTRGQFQCLECEEHFEPLPSPVYTIYSELREFRNTTRLCTRKQGIFPCGPYCQAEFPGCARIQISKVQGGSDSIAQETALFRCIEALPGYILLDKNVEADTSPFEEPKITTLPVYTSDLKKCDSRMCQSILHNCELYFKEHKDNMYETYYCKKCKSTMQPIPQGATGMTEILLYLYQRDPLSVCQQVPLEFATCDEECKLEFPGCDILSVSNIELDYYGTRAVYTCNKCAEGFVPVTNTSSIPSWQGGPFGRNVKLLCIPKEARQPTPVRGDMTRLLPKCLQYISKEVEDTYHKVFEYTCVQCEQGWESTGPVQSDWYSLAERFVCRHIALSNPVECNDDCKENFPNCNRLMISRTAANTPVYECLECSNGFYPIPYEREQFGRLSNVSNPVMRSSKIFLCSDLPEERYSALISCVGRNIYSEQTIPCATDDNCNLLATTRQISKGMGFWKCLECKQGYRIKSPTPSIFSADPTLCEKLRAASQHRRSSQTQASS